MGTEAGAAQERILDCAIVGGGPAGLTAAVYLGRFRRRFVLIDAGKSRLRRIPRTRNVPGFADGIEGRVLHERMRNHAAHYGALLVDGVVAKIEKRDGYFEVVTDTVTFLARTVLLATGVAVVDPQMAGLEDAIADGAVRYCPICDGYEAQGERIAVLGRRSVSINEAVFLRTYADDVTFVPADEALKLDGEQQALATAWGIRVEASAATELERIANGVRVTLANGRKLAFDILYPCLGSSARSGLLTALGGETSGSGGTVTDQHQETSVPGVFAAGDVLEGLDQIASACGQAAVAAVAIHNRLRAQDKAEAASAGRWGAGRAG